MKWEGNRQSGNVEDRRRGGGVGGRSIGLGSIVIALVAGWIFGINPMTILGFMDSASSGLQTQQAPAQQGPIEDRDGRFVSTVLADTEDVWGKIFRGEGAAYKEPRLVLFRGSTPTQCGQGQAAMGPFYCPADMTVYIDLSFFDELKNRLGAPGEFAQAYVIAHEVGHHIQRLMGTTQKLDQLRGKISQVEYNNLSVRLELQADCYAGVWGHHANQQRQILENGDIEKAMNAAARIGDDALQRASGRVVQPESFTHGTSAQRQRWFQTGMQTGDMGRCDTFASQKALTINVMDTTANPIRPQSTTREDSPALVYYSSRFGQAARVAQVLAERLTEQGHFAQARPLTATTATIPAHCPGVLLVASIRYGHFAPEGIDFVRINAEKLRTMPSGFVSVSLTARKPEKRSPQTHSYTRKFLLQANQLGWTPTWCSVLAGALRYPRYNWLDRQMIRLIMWITNGPTAPETDMEFTDWKQVDELAQSVSSALYLPSHS